MSLFACAGTAEAQFVLQPAEATSKDAKVYAFLPTMNFQSNLGVVGSGTAHSFKALIQFDLSAVPIGSGQISLATLELYCSTVTPIDGAQDSGPGDVSLYAVSAGWTEAGVTWITFPSFVSTATDTEFVDTAGRWYTFDITSLVQDWQSGALTNNGIAIIMDDPFGQVTFFDADGQTTPMADPSFAPKLTVVPEPGSAALTIAGIALAAGVRRRRRSHS